MDERGSAYTGVRPTGSPPAKGRRVALVIGNSLYRFGKPLLNPARDADALSEIFTALGFDLVQKHHDLGLVPLMRAFTNFRREADSADTAVIYFAGHGIEIDGINRLIPVDADLDDVIRVPDETVTLDRVQLSARGAKNLRVVILDACRDNPFLERMRGLERGRDLSIGGRLAIEDEGGRSIGHSVGQGLAVPTDFSNMLVAYAADAGKKAKDGPADGNSPFASALVEALRHDPSLDVRMLFGKVHDEVIKRTNGAQRPATYTQLGGGLFALATPAPVAAAIPERPRLPDWSTGPIDDRTVEHTRWVFLQTHGTVHDLAKFLHPNAPAYFSNDATRLLESRISNINDVEALEALDNEFHSADFGSLIDDRARKLILNISDLGTLSGLVEKYPSSARNPLMRNQLAEKSLEAIKRKPQPRGQDYMDYIAEFANYPQSGTARGEYAKLASQEWRKTSKRNLHDVRRFIDNFPDSTEAGEASEVLTKRPFSSIRPKESSATDWHYFFSFKAGIIMVVVSVILVLLLCRGVTHSSNAMWPGGYNSDGVWRNPQVP